MISSYFSRTGLKRNHSSTSDENDVSISSENDSKKQEKKRMNTVVEDSDMAVQTALENINRRLDTLATNVDRGEGGKTGVRSEVSEESERNCYRHV